MERRNFHRAPTYATYLLAGSIALAGCSGSSNPRGADTVPEILGCELPEYEADPVTAIDTHNSRNPLQKDDLTSIDISETVDQLNGFSEVASLQIESSGLNLRILTEGNLQIDPYNLERLFLSPFEVVYANPRLQATMECISDRMLNGELSGFEVPAYISSDPGNCINGLRFETRGLDENDSVKSCHAAGGSTPWRIAEISWLQNIVELQPRIYPVAVAPGVVSISHYRSHSVPEDAQPIDYRIQRSIERANREVNRILLHEYIHTQRWMFGAEFSILHPSVEESLVKHIERETMNYLDGLDDFEFPVRYSCEDLIEWNPAANPC